MDDPAGDAGYEEHPPRVGFFTDTSVSIGWKACEVASKEWHGVPDDGFNLLGMSFDNTGMLGAKRGGTSRSSSGQAETVASAIKQTARGGGELGTTPVEMGIPKFERRPGDATGAESRTDFRWLMSSDMCKHRTHAKCLDVCPTARCSALEFGTVVVQQDICNGCGYCVSACPYGVIDQGEDDGRAWKCTLCYDRLRDGLDSLGVCEGVSDGLSPRSFGDDAADRKMRAEVWRDRDAVIGGSDAGAHLDMMCGAIYTTSLLGHGAREHQVVTLEEALRWEPPISTVVRVARRGCELGGIAIPAGTSVSVIVAEANRDPDQNPEPDGPTRRG